MPFDYNSFLQGVQTGLRLGRTKLGRQPPVPSGRYILTESGEKVLTEKLDMGGITVFKTGIWYTLETPVEVNYYDHPFTEIRYRTAYFVRDGVIQYFDSEILYARISEISTRYDNAVIFSETLREPAVTAYYPYIRLVYEFRNQYGEQGNADSDSGIAYTVVEKNIGGIYGYFMGRLGPYTCDYTGWFIDTSVFPDAESPYAMWPIYTVYRPDGIEKVYECATIDDLWSYFAGRSHYPMITEERSE